MNAEINPLLLQRPALNPYRIAVGALLERIKWDLRAESRRSRRVLHRWRDLHTEQKAVILCNGPSLLKVDFEALRQSKVFCFGLNKVNLLFDKTDFRPSCIVAVNSFVIEQNQAFYNETDIPLFLDSHAADCVRSKDSVAFLHSSSYPYISQDCSLSVWQGHTVTTVALQLALHMGFSQVALVGADHNFATKGPANQTVVAQGPDNSHFDPNYFAHGVKWQLPDLFQSEVGYTMARAMYEAHGKKILNATDGGQLEVFDRCTLETFLSLG